MYIELALKETTESIRQLTAEMRIFIAAMQRSEVFAPENPSQSKADSANIKPKVAKKETVPEAEDISEESFEHAKKRLLELSKGGGHAKAVEILNSFGAQRLGQVPQENLAEVVTLAGIALGEVMND